ncbi:MAG: TIGR04255 family protein [Chthoniobacter sp.]|nr:TIGR04255 family protein [Chthoniobacter sp.]
MIDGLITQAIEMPRSNFKYAKPPIQEAICEIHFNVDEALSSERIEHLKEVWAAEYPDQKLNEEKGVKVEVGADGVRVVEDKMGHRLVCRSNDACRLVQLSGRFLAVNQLKPYPGWEEGFRDTITARAGEVQTRFGPFEIVRVGLRYINKIDVPQIPFAWEDWFNFRLPVPELKGAVRGPFQMRFEQQLKGSCNLIVNCVSLPSVGDCTPVILDLDVVWIGKPASAAKLSKLLETVHAPHRLAFEAYLTDKLREEFS